MPFQYTLANLLAKNDGAIAAIFLDEIGECVDLACADYTPYDMKILGAYIGIYLRQAGDIVRGLNAGNLSLLHIEREGLHLYAALLPDDYSLVLVQRRPGLSAQARRSLDAAREELTRELFCD